MPCRVCLSDVSGHHKRHIVVAAFSKQEKVILCSLSFSPYPYLQQKPIQTESAFLNLMNLISYFSKAGLSLYNPFTIQQLKTSACMSSGILVLMIVTAVASWLPVTSRYQQQSVVATLSDSWHKISEQTPVSKKTGIQFALLSSFSAGTSAANHTAQGWTKNREVFYFHAPFKRTLSITLFL